MVLRTLDKDLFGKPIKKRRPRYEWSLERADKNSLQKRASRIRWLTKVMPRNYSYMMPFETYYVFEEARLCFVYGHFVASIVLSTAFIDHWLEMFLVRRGYENEASGVLKSKIKFCRKLGFLNSVLLDKIDHLRLIRNPFVHLKDFSYPHTVFRRMTKDNSLPVKILENDAKEALSVMYTVAIHPKGQ